MAQLIKLQDYISRYETNIYQYPPQYIRLKKENWNKMQHLFERGMLEESFSEEENDEPLTNRKRLFRKSEQQETQKEKSSRDSGLPKTIDELKKYFLDGLFPFQLKWATTTLKEKSFLDSDYNDDELLKYFLQRFPDTYFILYNPVVKLRNAQMEALPIMIGPHGVEIIYYVKMDEGITIEPSSEKSWFAESGEVRTKILSPLLALNRTETFLRSVWKAYDIEFPIRKVVLAPDHPFKKNTEPYGTKYIGKEQYDDWLHEKRAITSTMKHVQLKAADSLLRHCLTVAVKRPEWDAEEEYIMEE